jgi:hypothetical protein
MSKFKHRQDIARDWVEPRGKATILFRLMAAQKITKIRKKSRKMKLPNSLKELEISNVDFEESFFKKKECRMEDNVAALLLIAADYRNGRMEEWTQSEISVLVMAVMSLFKFARRCFHQ